MSKANAIIRFLNAARSLANQGMSKEAIMQFAKNEFGEITELFQRQIDNIFKRPASGIEKIKIKDEVFDDTVIKLPYDDQLQPFNPKNPLKYYGKPKQNRPDVYGIDDYNTTNMSDIKKQIIRTETKLGNLNPDSPDFKDRAKVLIDEIEDLKSKLKDDKPRTDKYTGGIVDVEPTLSDIGHGSDALMARTRLLSPGAQGTTSTGLNYLLAEDNDNIRIPFQEGLSANKFDLSNLESLQNLKNNSGIRGKAGPQGRSSLAASQRDRIKNKVISSFIYAVDNMDQEKSTYVKNLFNGALQIGYETDMSGIKTDLFEKSGIVPINSETIYKTIVDLNLPKEIKAEMAAISNTAGDKELSASLKKNNMGITWDSDSQQIIGEYIFTLGTDGDTQIQPIVVKDQDSQISKEVKIDQAVGDGTLNFTLNESDIDNTSGASVNYQNDSVKLFADKQSDDYSNVANFGGTIELPFYLLNNEEKPYVSAEINKNLDSGFESKLFSGEFPLTDNLKIYGSRYEDDQGDFNETNYGLKYDFNKPIGEYGNFYTRANIDNQGDYGVNVGFSIPFGEREEKPFSYTTNNPEEAYNLYKQTDGFKYEPNVERMPPRMFAEGGRIGFSKGKLADAARRKFMKVAGAGAAGLAALKTGLIGLAEKAGPQVEMVKETVTGAPDYFFDLVSKIKMFGKKSKIGPQERVDEYSYTGKNGDEYVLTEDIVTGDAQITKDKMGGVRVSEDEMTDGIVDRSVMEYKSGKGMADESSGGALADEYDEYRVEFDMDGTASGADNIDESVQKEIIEEASEKITKKADGGRIGYSKGKLALKAGEKIKTIGSRTLAFLEKIFGKEAMAEMPSRDPELYKGLLEVTEAFRARDKEGLKMYLQKYLPHMDDTEIEEFIIGTRPDIEGIQGQLLRLGSGRDYKGKLDMMREASQKRKLADLEVTEEMIRKPNASGGIAKLLGE